MLIVVAFSQLLFWQKPAGRYVLLFVYNRSINNSHYEFGKVFVARITLSHAFKNWNKNVTDQLTSNIVFWLKTLASLFELCKTCPNCLALRRFSDFNHQTVTSNNIFFLFSSVTCDADAELSSLSLSALVMIFEILSHCRHVCCISARFNLFVSRHCSVQFIWSFR